MGLSEAIYGSCSAAFLALIALVLLRSRISGPGVAIIGACALTAAWAADLAMPEFLPRAASPVLDSLRLSVWLILVVTLIGVARSATLWIRVSALLLTIGFCVVVVGY
jgi:hypothetical protein